MNRLIEDAKAFEGNVVCIGVKNTKLLKVFKTNKKIGLYELTRGVKRKLFSRQRKVKMENGKSVRIKKFRKLFKKKSIEYLIIDLNSVFDYFKYMVANSIYICNKKIYLYGQSDYIDANTIVKKFKRYKTNVEYFQNKNEYLVIVDVSEAKYSYFKNKFYIIIDTFHNLGDMISYFLTS